MAYLVEGAEIEHEGVTWTALDLSHSRWLDYHGPSVVESEKGRLFAEASPDGKVNLFEVRTTPGKTTYGDGPTGTPGRQVGETVCDPKDVFDDPAAADPTATGPGSTP